MFKRIKEKLVGKTIEFIPSFDCVIKNVISGYKGDYAKCLQENTDLIVETFIKSETNNLRILKYCLDDHKQVYSHIQTNHQQVKDTLSKKILEFQLASAFEIMTGNYTKNDFKNYTSTSYGIMELSEEEAERLSKTTGQASKSKNLAPFLQKYFPDTYNQYPFYPSIWRLILEGRFISTDFDQEIQSFYPKEEESDMVLVFLGSYWELPDKEFETKVKTIMGMVERAEIAFSRIPRVFYILERLVNSKAIPIDIDNLKEIFNRGLDIYAKREASPVEFDTDFELFETKGSPVYKEMKGHFYSVNENLKAKSVENTINEFVSLMNNDLEEFCRRLGSKHGEYSQLKLFKFFNIEELIAFVRKAENGDLIKVRNAIESRYGFSNISDFYLEELENLKIFEQHLQVLIEEYEKEATYSVKLHLIRVLKDTISSIVARLGGKSS